jgi:hypothetical protein
MGDNVHGMLPNFFISGCINEAVIRANFKVNLWARSYFRNSDAFLCNSFELRGRLKG